jgi:hypothetical protein
MQKWFTCENLPKVNSGTKPNTQVVRKAIFGVEVSLGFLENPWN